MIGLGCLVALLTLAEVVNELMTGHVWTILREGLIITGWVAMWRPLEVLLYDWWPLAQRRGQIARILDAEIQIVQPPHMESPPGVSCGDEPQPASDPRR